MFPLRLTPFEESFLADDRTGYELDILVRMELRGEADRAALDAAFQASLRRHPLISAGVRKSRWGRYEWTADSEFSPVIDWISAGDVADPFPPTTRVHAKNGTPISMRAHVHQGRTTLIYQVHHTRTDGAGTFQFLGDLLVAYSRATGGTGEFLPLDESRLIGRNRCGLSAWGLLKKLPRLSVGLHGVRQFLARRPVILAPLTPKGSDRIEPDGSLTEMICLSPDETSSLRAAAKRISVTLNDLLTRDLFLAIHHWRDHRGLASEGDWMRLMIPINMRRPEDQSIPAANIVSTVYLDRQPDQCSDATELLKSVHDEMYLIKDRDLGLIFLLTLAICGSVPGGIARLTSGQECVATAVFTNTMRPADQWLLPKQDGRFVAGNLTLESLELYAPLRRNTLLACAALTYADRLRICVRCDARGLTRDDCQDFVAGYRERLLNSAKLGGGAL